MVNAYEELRELNRILPDLAWHVSAKFLQRADLKVRQLNLKWYELLFMLDYGGFTDSRGGKISVWSCTVFAPRPRKQEHFDFFFDASNAGKNGQTGIYFLGELLDGTLYPDLVALIHQRFPDGRHLTLSGDTGNGYRAYEMIEELSKIFMKFGFTVQLIPLSPGHAFNPTDARIAHMNTFLVALKRSSRIFGAEQVARAFRAAADPTCTIRKFQRKFMARSFEFFRVVPPAEESAEESKKELGAFVEHAVLDKGRMGVHGLLYFDFSFVHANGDLYHPESCAGSATKRRNTTRQPNVGVLLEERIGQENVSAVQPRVGRF